MRGKQIAIFANFRWWKLLQLKDCIISSGDCSGDPGAGTRFASHAAWTYMYTCSIFLLQKYVCATNILLCFCSVLWVIMKMSSGIVTCTCLLFPSFTWVGEIVRQAFAWSAMQTAVVFLVSSADQFAEVLYGFRECTWKRLHMSTNLRSYNL